MSSFPVATRAAAQTRSRSAVWTPLALIALALVTRVPLWSRMLYHWDSVNLAFAIERFDVAEGRPQAPGYLLYVLLGRLAAWLMGSAQFGYVLLATLGTALSAVALYDLGRRMWNERVGILAALLLLSSPLFWFYGEVALPHTLDALMVIVAADLSWRVWSGEHRIALWLALWLGIAGGVRQQTLVFLLPLAIVACRRLPLRWIAGAVTILAVTVLSWLIPLLVLSGGLTRYLAIVGAYSEAFDRPTSVFLGAGWAGLTYNLNKLARYTLWGWALAAILAWFSISWRSGTLRGIVRSRRAWLLALWIAPSLFFYTLIHMGQQGLIFVYLPVLLLISALGATVLLDRGRWGRGLVAAVIIGNSLLYLGSPRTLLPNRLKVLSQATIREQDALLNAQIMTIRRDLPPDALLLADQWRFPQYYVPNAPLIPLQQTDPESGSPPQALEAATIARVRDATALAWYEPRLDRANTVANRTVTLSDRGGAQLRVLRRQPNERFWIKADAFGIERATP